MYKANTDRTERLNSQKYINSTRVKNPAFNDGQINRQKPIKKQWT